jgi:hypothetical protein
MSDNDNDLRTRVDVFVNELSALIRRQALEAVEEVLKKGAEPAAAAPAAAVAAALAPRKRGRPTKAAAAARAKALAKPAPAPAAPAPKSTAAAAAAAAKRKSGEKRTPQQLAQITEQTYLHIKSNGNQGVEQIAKALGTSTKELTLPIRKLLADKKIGSKGQKRATRYFPVR